MIVLHLVDTIVGNLGRNSKLTVLYYHYCVFVYVGAFLISLFFSLDFTWSSLLLISPSRVSLANLSVLLMLGVS